MKKRNTDARRKRKEYKREKKTSEKKPMPKRSVRHREKGKQGNHGIKRQHHKIHGLEEEAQTLQRKGDRPAA